MSRRTVLKSGLLLIGIAAVPASRALAQSKASKSAMQYQDQPKDGKDCEKCIQFIPGKTKRADGTCKVVEGAISPHGYCIVFAPKPKG